MFACFSLLNYSFLWDLKLMKIFLHKIITTVSTIVSLAQYPSCFESMHTYMLIQSQTTISIVYFYAEKNVIFCLFQVCLNKSKTITKSIIQKMDYCRQRLYHSIWCSHLCSVTWATDSTGSWLWQEASSSGHV